MCIADDTSEFNHLNADNYAASSTLIGPFIIYSERGMLHKMPGQSPSSTTRPPRISVRFLPICAPVVAEQTNGL